MLEGHEMFSKEKAFLNLKEIILTVYVVGLENKSE